MKTIQPRIYAACLASYNNGVLHGRWIDADQDADDIQAEINEMLRESKYPNVSLRDCECLGCGHEWQYQVSPPIYTSANQVTCPECGHAGVKWTDPYSSAEEYAIHDYDSMPDGLGEYEDLETISLHGKMVVEHGEAWNAYVKIAEPDELSEEDFQERHQGEYDSLKDYVEDQVAEHYGYLLDVMNERHWCQVAMGTYLDVEQMTHDLQCSGGVVISDGHVFEVG